MINEAMVMEGVEAEALEVSSLSPRPTHTHRRLLPHPINNLIIIIMAVLNSKVEDKVDPLWTTM